MIDTSGSAAAEWGEVGDALRDARERTGLTLHELSRRTRITVPLLEALERGQVDKLPRGPFARGFARAFAAEVGLDVDRLLARVAAEESRPAPAAETIPDVELTSRTFIRRLLGSAFIVALAVAVPRWLGAPEDPEVAEAIGTAGVQTPDAPAPAPTVLRTQPQAVLTVELHAIDEVWMDATVDGARVAYELWPAGTRKVLNARSSIDLTVGDAGALEYSVNGVPAAPLGPRGLVREIHLSP